MPESRQKREKRFTGTWLKRRKRLCSHSILKIRALEGIQQGIQQGIQKGIQQGLLEGITALIEIKFGDRGMKILSEIGNIHDAGRLRQIKDAIKGGLDVQEIEKMILH
jgi:hypothetical protein